ncbi:MULTISPECIES: LytR C-terminal domain-containing protein [unclassified Leucobacter]|uniref:LytR C-terminal domain-containing protein n=1 Tax=unclassified Leucobacter TaxID=2621730 RepID=UPI00165D3D59|nr:MULTISPECIES: LytR C-terminal domain-containing protein [unclassified Leucobacter]MBC9936654.1 LytR C-terminal domain-containing protein [Leucobacter sp. cx-87]
MAQKQSAESSGEARASGTRAPQDRYDLVERSHRVGVHRSPERAGSFWLRALMVLLTAAVLATLGIVFIVIGPGNVQLPGAVEETKKPAPVQVVGEIDPAATIAILNGSPADGLEDNVDQAIRTGALGDVIFAGVADQRDVTISAIFYVDPKDEAFAKGLGEQLGGASYYLQPDYASYGARLIVLLGSDYRGPGAVEMPSDTPAAPAEETPAEEQPAE